jgi:hypothetical protein
MLPIDVIKIEVNSRSVKENDPIHVPGGPTMIITPPIDEDFWLYRVKLKHGQAITVFPKFGTLGCGFALEEDWNTNLPLECGSAEKIYHHIKHNKRFADISDQSCIAAIRALQEFVKNKK